jgi:hypothetical protein
LRRASPDAELDVRDLLGEGLPQCNFSGKRNARIGITEIFVADIGRRRENIPADAGTDADLEQVTDGANGDRPRCDIGPSRAR